MRKINLLFFALLLLGTLPAMAQSHTRCAADEHLHEILEQYPETQQRMDDIERFVENYLQTHEAEARSNTPVTIPVVVHVVWNNAVENIPNAQILNQIQTLNQDFNRTNPDAVNTPPYFALNVGNPQINFCLATRDPAGFFTTGIVRQQTTVPGWGITDAVKTIAGGGSRAWPTSDYLNIWVCNLTSGLGWAYYPGTAPLPEYEGVVVGYQWFGNTTDPQYNLGRTCTHEVGHYFNVLHPWGFGNSGACGNDFCFDTPRPAGTNGTGPNFNCPTFPVVPTCPGETAQSEMFMNFMDYVDDACMNMFSQDQAVRMCATLAPGGPRASLLNSQGCQPPCTWGLYGIPWATSITSTSAVINWTTPTPTGGGVTVTGFTVRYRIVGTQTWTTVFVPGPAVTSTTITGLTPLSNYEFDVQVACSGGGISGWAGLSTFSTPATVCAPDPFEPNNTLGTAFLLNTPGTTVWPYICPTTDVDIFQISNSYLTPDIMINMNVLPADYAMDLLDASGTIVATSVNPGLTPEVIFYQNGPVQTYYIRVYSQTGAFNPAAPYSLTYNLANSCAHDGFWNHSTGTAPNLINGDVLQGTLCPQLEEDYFAITHDPANPDVTVTLSGLSNDYDLRLLDNVGNVVTTSITAGLSNETINFNSTGGTTYYAVVYSSLGNFHTTNTYTLSLTQANNSSSRVGFVKDSWFDELQIYPSPVVDELTIRYQGQKAETTVVEVLDVLGKVVMNQEFESQKGSNTFTLDLQHLVTGSYFIRLSGQEHSVTTKIVVQ